MRLSPWSHMAITIVIMNDGCLYEGRIEGFAYKWLEYPRNRSSICRQPCPCFPYNLRAVGEPERIFENALSCLFAPLGKQLQIALKLSECRAKRRCNQQGDDEHGADYHDFTPRLLVIWKPCARSNFSDAQQYMEHSP